MTEDLEGLLAALLAFLDENDAEFRIYKTRPKGERAPRR